MYRYLRDTCSWYVSTLHMLLNWVKSFGSVMYKNVRLGSSHQWVLLYVNTQVPNARSVDSVRNNGRPRRPTFLPDDQNQWADRWPHFDDLIKSLWSTLKTFLQKYGWPKFLTDDQNLVDDHDFFLISNAVCWDALKLYTTQNN